MEESFDKPSFLIYKHDFNSISYFSDELLGLLFRTICEYQNDKKVNIDVDPRINQYWFLLSSSHLEKSPFYLVSQF